MKPDRINLRAGSGLFTAAILLLISPSTGHAVPSFARQMDSQCIKCHTEFPVLNEFGRTFKLAPAGTPRTTTRSTSKRGLLFATAQNRSALTLPGRRLLTPPATI